jgi:ketosteroid isomerase-like protein
MSQDNVEIVRRFVVGDLEEALDGGDLVVATVLSRGRGRGSGIEIDARFHRVYTLRDDRIVRMDEFAQRAEALEAAGLSE